MLGEHQREQIGAHRELSGPEKELGGPQMELGEPQIELGEPQIELGGALDVVVQYVIVSYGATAQRPILKLYLWFSTFMVLPVPAASVTHSTTARHSRCNLKQTEHRELLHYDSRGRIVGQFEFWSISIIIIS